LRLLISAADWEGDTEVYEAPSEPETSPLFLGSPMQVHDLPLYIAVNGNKK
jgi:hypothetical protein